MFGFQTLRALWQSDRHTGARKRVSRRTRLMLEELEDRRMLSTPSVGFALSSSSASESLSQANLVAALSAVSNQPVTVDYHVTGGTAAGAGVDYTLANGTLTFNPGQTRLSIPIAIVNDALDESGETILVTLANPGNAAMGPISTHTHTILDDDPLPAVSFDLTSSSGDEGTSPADLSVSLSAASGRTVTVKYYTSGMTARPALDYVADVGQLTFLPGETTKAIPLNVLDDALDENDEKLGVVLFGAVNATLGDVIHIYTILDNDAPPSVSFVLAATSTSELLAFPVIEVRLSAASGKTVAVQYTDAGGTATRGLDYTLAGARLTFAPGKTVRKIPLAVVNDHLDEADETVLLALSAPTNAVLGGTVDHTLTILDDDGLPTVSFRRATSSGSEGQLVANLLVSLSRPSGKTVTVDYAPVGGTATNGVDYALSPGTLSFSPGKITKAIPLILIDDMLDEDNETVLVTLANPVNADLGARPAHTFVILDNDRPPVLSFQDHFSSGSEGNLVLDFIVKLSVPSERTITVHFGVTGGTARLGIDYLFSSGTLTFLPGETSKTISLTLIDDAELELAETVRLGLSGFVNALVGLNPVHIFTIQDDEPVPIP